jgi:6-pyruvoyltetrahydropterin/6-carboxytetrahydropterin synthase
VKASQWDGGYVNGLGIIIDFKDLKAIVQAEVVNKLDHKLILSRSYLNQSNPFPKLDELIVFDVEPTAENLLIFARDLITNALPDHVQLQSLKLWETRDSYAAWSL